MKTYFQPQTIFTVLFMALAFIAEPAFAQAAGGSLPWEGPLNTLAASLGGNAAKAIGVIALAAAGAMLAFGGEIGEFAKRMCMVVMALSILLLGSSVIATIK